MPYLSSNEAVAAGPSGSQPKVYIVPFQSAPNVVTPQARTEVEAYYRTLVSMNSSVHLIDPTGPNAAPVPVPAPKKTAPEIKDRTVLAADANIQTAKSMAAQGKWAGAAKLATRAVRSYEKKLALLPGVARLEAAYTLLVQVRFGQGFEDDAEDLLWRLLAINPNANLSAFSNPKVEAAVQRVRRRLRIPTGTLKVACSAPSCTVSIDGKAISGTEVSGIPRGMHYVQVTAPGHKPWAKTVEAPARGQTLVVKARQRKMSRAEIASAGGTPAPVVQAPAQPADSRELQRLVNVGDFGTRFKMAADTFCRQSGAQYVVMGYMNRIGGQYVLAGFLYSASLRQVAEVSSAMIPLDVKGVQSKMMAFEGRIARSMRRFPAERVVVVKPSIYQQAAQIAVAPTPVPAAPTPAPVSPVPVPTPAPTVQPAPVTAPTPQQYPPVVAPVPSQFPPQQPTPTANPTYRPQPTYRAPVPTPSQFPMTPTATPPVAPAPVPVAPAPVAPMPVAPVPVAPAPAPIAQPAPVAPTPAPVVPAPTVMRRPAPAPAPVVGETMEIEDETPVYKTWWLWTIVGAVVVGGAVAAGVLLAPGDEPPKNFNATATFE